MAQSGYTPILTYGSSTAAAEPTAPNLTSSANGAELALNYADGKLFYKNSGGNVRLLAIGYGASTVTPTAGGIQYGTGTAVAFTAAGTAGYILQSNGASAPSWVAAPSTSPGGSTTQVQYNNAGAFAGSANFVWDNTNVRLGIGTSSPAAKLHTSTTTAGNSVGALLANPNQSGSADSVSINFGLGRTADSFLFSIPAISFVKEQQWTSTGSTVDGALTFSTILNETASEKMRLDSSGNLGLGVTPSGNWSTSYSQKAFQFGPVGAVSSLSASAGNSQVTLSNNVADLAVGAKYLTSDYASFYKQVGGQHQWSYAASGTAGNAITFTQAMTLDASGNLGVGTTSPGSFNSNQTYGAVIGNGTSLPGLTLYGGSSSGGSLNFADGTTGTEQYRGSVEYNHGSDYMAFRTTGTIRVRIDSSGNLGIGLTPVADNGILQLNSYGAIKALIEGATVSATAATGTINYDAATQAVVYYTSNASANWTVNFRGSGSLSLNSMMQTGQSLTLAFLVTQGSTAYYNSAVQVDGSSVTPKWQGGTAPSAGNASSIDSYVYTIIKTGAATFTVLASQTKFA